MRNSLGISTGASGVCSALVASDDTGVRDIEYRTISADLGTHTDPGDLAISAIELMTTQVPDRRIEPDAIVVAYRTEAQAVSVRSAAKSQKRAIRLVPESTAALTYLWSTGLVAQYGVIALVDLGASGLTVTVMDQTDGTVHVRDRTAEVSADGAADADTHTRMTEFVSEVLSRALRRPEALVLIGGGGRIPGVATALEDAFDATTIDVTEPEAATAKGAALLAGSPERQKFPLVTGSGGRVSGALVAAVVAGGLMLGYGVKEMVPTSEENYSPTGSQIIETPTTDPVEPPPVTDAPDIPSNDPYPTTTVPPWQSQVPTYDYGTPEPSTDYPTFEEPTTTTPAPAPGPGTTTPTTTPPTTTPEPLPWIPPKWPEMPTWLPDLVPGVPTPNPGTPPVPPPPPPPPNLQKPAPDAGSTDTAEEPAAPGISPEPGSPRPEVPGSSPR